MNRIPPVRTWRVRFYCEKILLAEIDIETINKRFALWAAQDRLRERDLERFLARTKESVSLVKQRNSNNVSQ